MAPKAKKIAKADKPKKKLSGYMKFAKERRPSLLKEKPNLSFGEVRAPSPLARARPIHENVLTPKMPSPTGLTPRRARRWARRWVRSGARCPTRRRPSTSERVSPHDVVGRDLYMTPLRPTPSCPDSHSYTHRGRGAPRLSLPREARPIPGRRPRG